KRRMVELWSKIGRMLRLRRGLHDDLREEVRSHIEFLVEEQIEQGLPAREARAAARRRFGNEITTLERAREAWQFPRFETFLQDLRYGLRGIRKSPGFSLILILTLGLGVGATTAIFSVVYAVLIKPLPYPSGERLVWIGESTPKAPGISVTWINFQHWRNENTAFEDMAGYLRRDLTMTGRGDALLTHAGIITSNFFRLTGSGPLMGRVFTEDDDRPGAAGVVVLSSEFWTSTLGADREVLG